MLSWYRIARFSASTWTVGKPVAKYSRPVRKSRLPYTVQRSIYRICVSHSKISLLGYALPERVDDNVSCVGNKQPQTTHPKTKCWTANDYISYVLTRALFNLKSFAFVITLKKATFDFYILSAKIAVGEIADLAI